MKVVTGVSVFMTSEARIGLYRRKATCGIFLRRLVSTELVKLAKRMYLGDDKVAL